MSSMRHGESKRKKTPIGKMTLDSLDFDPGKERFTGDSEADAMLTRDYRKPFVVGA